MAKEKVDELEIKKKKLEEELHNIQDELDNSIDKAREDVSSSLDPKNIIRKYPLSVVGASSLLGFLLGHKNKNRSSDNRGSERKFTGALLSELKRLATRKAITFATDYVEELLEKKAEEHLVSDEIEENNS